MGCESMREGCHVGCESMREGCHMHVGCEAGLGEIQNDRIVGGLPWRLHSGLTLTLNANPNANPSAQVLLHICNQAYF